MRDRLQTFVTRGLSARSELDSAEAALKVAEGRYQDALEEVRNRQALVAQRRSELEIARQQRSDAVLTAPFDGMIRKRTSAIGQYVSAGVPIATLVRVDPLRLRLEVPEREAALVATGQKVKVTVDGDTASSRGNGRAAQSCNRRGEPHAARRGRDSRPRRAGIRPGSFARATIVVDAGVPARCPRYRLVGRHVRGSRQGVRGQRRQGGRKAGATRPKRSEALVEVVNGLARTDAVVADPGALVAGQAVSVRR